MIYIPAGGESPRVRPDDLTKTGAKRIRRLARGSRGTARGHGPAPAPRPADERPADERPETS